MTSSARAIHAAGYSLNGKNSMLLDNSPLTWNRHFIPESDRRAEPTTVLLRRRSRGDAIKTDRISPGVCVAERDGVTGQSSNNKVCPTKKIGSGLHRVGFGGSAGYLQVKNALIQATEQSDETERDFHFQCCDIIRHGAERGCDHHIIQSSIAGV